MNKQGFGQVLSPMEFTMLQKGKQGGFVAAYQLYADHVYSLSFHLVCDEEIAADILQSVFETLLNKAHTIREIDKLGAWIKTCAVNACMEYFRRVKKEREYINKQKEQTDNNHVLSQPSEDLASCNYQSSEVAQLISQLPVAQRSIVYLHAVQNLKHRDIAKNIGVNEDNSRQSYRRALKQLKAWLTRTKYE